MSMIVRKGKNVWTGKTGTKKNGGEGEESRAAVPAGTFSGEGSEYQSVEAGPRYVLRIVKDRGREQQRKKEKLTKKKLTKVNLKRLQNRTRQITQIIKFHPLQSNKKEE